MCRSFLVSLFQVSVQRIRVVQKKIMEGQSFKERRGQHENRPKKLSKEVWELAMAHLKSIPNHESHYSANKTNRLYFLNPDLTIKQIYEEFKKYFKEKTGEHLTMAYKTYFKFVKETNFAFKKPKSNTCDYYAECEQKIAKNPHDEWRVQFDLHKRKEKAFFDTKNKFIEEAKN